jgi:phosphatidylserine decarboxylase
MSTQLKILYHYLLPKHFLTWLAGHLAESKISWLKNYLIRDFLKKFAVNMNEAVESNPFAYPSFNAFFTRRLKENARPIAKAKYVFPADGAIAETGKIHQDRLLQAKGIDYRLQDLLATEAPQYINGNFMTIYLAPKDYHRVHLPVDARLLEQIYIPGRLFSVQPFTTAHIPNVFSQNERLVLNFETQAGPFTMVLVGATIVGCMGTAWDGDLKRQSSLVRKTMDLSLKQGDEIGYFKLGSTVIILWPESTPIHWCQQWAHGMTTLVGQAISD